jgi:5'-3' exonuclease
MKKYLLVDLANTYFRALHASARGSDLEERVSFAVHCALQSIASAWRDQNATHVVVMLEGHSWRKDFYKPYKANREVARMAQTEKEQKDGEAFFAALNELIDFFINKTNVTVIRHPNLEADDLIAGWIQNHPLDEHVIVSTDTDFYQLLAENVTQYSGVLRQLHTINGVFDAKGKAVVDKKTGFPIEIPDPKYILFEKCVRGDPTDNVFSAYPGARSKGSKNKIGIQEAFADRNNKGFNYNNFMLQKWVDHNKVEHRVLDDYARNVILVDLSAQPATIREQLDKTILESAVPKKVPMVGAHFLKFCGKYNLVKLSDQATTYGTVLGTSYIKD